MSYIVSQYALLIVCLYIHTIYCCYSAESLTIFLSLNRETHRHRVGSECLIKYNSMWKKSYEMQICCWDTASRHRIQCTSPPLPSAKKVQVVDIVVLPYSMWLSHTSPCNTLQQLGRMWTLQAYTRHCSMLTRATVILTLDLLKFYTTVSQYTNCNTKYVDECEY